MTQSVRLIKVSDKTIIETNFRRWKSYLPSFFLLHINLIPYSANQEEEKS
jgi:hypothetical protein